MTFSTTHASIAKVMGCGIPSVILCNSWLLKISSEGLIDSVQLDQINEIVTP